MKTVAIAFALVLPIAVAATTPPPGVPPNYCPAPGGSWIDCRCITTIAPGTTITRVNGKTMAVLYQPWLPPGQANLPQVIPPCPNPVVYDGAGRVKPRLSMPVPTNATTDTIQDGWLVGSYTTFGGPPFPLHISSTFQMPKCPASGTLYYFNGFQALVPSASQPDQRPFIIQPVAACSEGNSFLTVWRCDDGTNCFHPPAVYYNNSDTLKAVVDATQPLLCNFWTGACPEWKISLLDLTDLSKKTELVTDVAGQTMSMAVSMVLEVYNIGPCSHLPASGGMSTWDISIWGFLTEGGGPQVMHPRWFPGAWQTSCHVEATLGSNDTTLNMRWNTTP